PRQIFSVMPVASRTRIPALQQGAAAPEPQMCIRARRRDASARSSRDEPLLQQVRLVHLAESLSLFADRRRKALDPDRTAVEFLDYRGENRAVHPVEAARVDFEQFER